MNGLFVAAATTGVDYGGMFGGMKTETMNGINEALPIALSVAGILLAIGLGYKLFKRFAK